MSPVQENRRMRPPPTHEYQAPRGDPEHTDVPPGSHDESREATDQQSRDLFYSSKSSPLRNDIIAPNEYNFDEWGQHSGIPLSMRQ